MVRQVRAGDALLAPSTTRRQVERFARQGSAHETLRRDLSALTARG